MSHHGKDAHNAVTRAIDDDHREWTFAGDDEDEDDEDDDEGDDDDGRTKRPPPPPPVPEFEPSAVRLVVTNGSKIRPAISRGMPGPVSLTRIPIVPSALVIAAIVRRPP